MPLMAFLPQMATVSRHYEAILIAVVIPRDAVRLSCKRKTDKQDRTREVGRASFICLKQTNRKTLFFKSVFYPLVELKRHEDEKCP